MKDLPEVLRSGERARLIPVVADASKEKRAASVLLACIMSVDDFSQSLMAGIGQRLGGRAKIQCFTEVVFKTCPTEIKHRPDGLLAVATGKRTWSALVEAKIGRAALTEDQIKDYMQLAKINGIDAVITVSNQFAALPTHHPVQLSKIARRGVHLFHWSWMHVLTQATLLLSQGEFASEDQRFILDEMVRHFEHESVGVFGFDRMNPEWKELVVKVQSGAALSKTAPEIENSVAAWHQESRDLCLIMSRKLGRNVSLRLSKAHKRDPVRRLKDGSEELAKTATLSSVLDVPDAAAPITVTADLRRRTLSCSMRLAAPRDKKRSSARINWLVRQLASTEPQDIFLTALWPKRAQNTQAALSEARENPRILESDNQLLRPQYFEVLMVKDIAGKFSGTKTFIEQIEMIVPEYYEQVGQHLRPWVPPPPKFVEKEISDSEAEVAEPHDDIPDVTAGSVGQE